MTKPDEDAGGTASSDARSGAEPASAGYEAPPIEQASEPTQQLRATDYPQPAAYPGQEAQSPGYEAPPSYEALPSYGTDVPPSYGTQPGYAQPGFAPPEYPAAGYPPQQGYGVPPAPDPFGYGAPAPSYGTPQYGAPGYGTPPPGYGAPQYGAPGFGAPAPGYGPPPPYAPGYGTQPGSQTNSMAIASIVSSGLAIPLFFACYIGVIAAIIGIVLGVIALNQTKTTGQNGKELAIAGIVLGGVVLAGGLVLGLIVGAAYTL